MNKGIIFASILILAFSFVIVSAEGGDRERAPVQGHDGNFSKEQKGDWNGTREDGKDAQNWTEMPGERKGRPFDINISSENDGNETKFRAHFSNGRNAEIKVMPDRASQNALEHLKMHFCNETNNCAIQLKDVGQGNESKASYEVQAERHFKLFGLFSKKAQVRAEVDAQSGNVTATHKPWWSFLASQPAE